MGRMTRYAVVIAAVIAVLAVAAALGFALRGGGDSASSAGPVPTVGRTTSAPTEPSPTEAVQAPCGSRTFLAVLRHALLPAGDEDQIAKAEVVDCRNDYARVNALPDKSNCPPNCYEGSVAYLRWTGDNWRILDFGTGIDCEDVKTLPPLPGPVRRACLALGYPQPRILTTETFRMPSGNIGCVLQDTELRCDILSGLTPEPAEPCELDWVGLILPAKGPPKPHCAGDTAFQQGEPTLEYGDDWHRGGFWCESEPDGLLCMNRRDGSFHLAREGWEGG
jgi:uncharacterized protein DUF6636